MLWERLNKFGKAMVIITAVACILFFVLYIVLSFCADNVRWGYWFLGMLGGFITISSIVFADDIFYWRIFHWVEDPDSVEPSEDTLYRRYAGWVVMLIATVIVFAIGIL